MKTNEEIMSETIARQRDRIKDLETAMREAAWLTRLGAEYMRQHLVIEEWNHFFEAAGRFSRVAKNIHSPDDIRS